MPLSVAAVPVAVSSDGDRRIRHGEMSHNLHGQSRVDGVAHTGIVGYGINHAAGGKRQVAQNTNRRGVVILYRQYNCNFVPGLAGDGVADNEFIGVYTLTSSGFRLP